MRASAASFEARVRGHGSGLDGVAAKFEEAVRTVLAPTGALLFCSGRAARDLKELVSLASVRLPAEVPVLAVSGPGVLSERGELEGESAVTGMVWSGIPCSLSMSSERSLTADSMGRLIAPAAGEFEPTLLFLRSEGLDPDALWHARQSAMNPCVFGAGTHGEPGIVCATNGKVTEACGASLRFLGAPPLVATAHSCRLLHPLLPITRIEGSTVLELGGRPALERLNEIGQELQGQPLLFTVLSEAETEGDLLVRGIQGIDPDRGALLVGREAKEGSYMSFAIRDSGAARDEVVRCCRSVQRSLAGAAPSFALYFNCSGRGQTLYRSPNVDNRLIRERFPRLPIAGCFSAFEINTFASGPALQLFTGVLVMFRSPS